MNTPTIAKHGEVVRTKEGRKYVVDQDHPLPEGAEIISDRPHGDGDFSYCCGFDYCKCMQ